MATSVIGALRVNLGLDSAQFEKGAKRSQSTIKVMRTQFLAVSGAAAGMGVALSAAALRSAADIDKLAKSARRIDSSIGGFRALQLAAGESGVSLDTLVDSVQTMEREIAKGSKGAGEALKTLGLNARSLDGLDADQKIATIADAIKAMGLTTAQASVVLQQLGVRNRETVLAVISGGDALRSARKDIQDYGLAIARVDSEAIEAANDRIARLGLIGQYAGQQLAIALVPALGKMAQAMTDSLREGGLLRIAIDGLVNNLDVLAFSVGSVVAVAGGKFVAALAASTLAMARQAVQAGIAATAMRALGVATAFAGGPLGAVLAIMGLGAAAAVAFGRDTDTAEQAMSDAEKAASDLGTELGILSGNDLPVATAKTVDLANANLTLARSAYAAAQAQMEVAKANVAAAYDQSAMEDMFLPGVENPGQAIYAKRVAELEAALGDLAEAEAELNARVIEGNKVKLDATEVVRSLDVNIRGLDDAAGGASKGLKDTKDTAKDLADQLDGPLTTAIDGVSSAFGDFFARRFKDFKSFTKSIGDSFKRMFAQIAADAMKNRIIMPVVTAVMGGTGTAASAAGSMLGGGGGLLGGIGSAVGAAGGIGGALGAVGSGLGGILSGGGLGASFANLGGLLSGSAGGLGAVGAALPAIGVIAAPLAIGALLLNRRKKRRQRRQQAEQAAAQAAAQEADRQTAIRNQGFDIETRVLELQGRSVEALARARQKELEAIDPANRALAQQVFALEDMARAAERAAAVSSERFDIENRLLTLQGAETEVLARNRQKELEAIDATNRAMLEQVFALEDQQALAENLNATVQRTMDLFRAPLSLDSERFSDRFSATMQAAEDRRARLQQEADDAQLTELKLMRLALEQLARETRDASLYGATA